MMRYLLLLALAGGVGITLGALIAVELAGDPLPAPAAASDITEVWKSDLGPGSRDDDLATGLLNSLGRRDREEFRKITRLTADLENLLYDNQGEILRTHFGKQPDLEFLGVIALDDSERRSLWRIYHAEIETEALLSLWVRDEEIWHFRIER